jgi:hypothetical protein
MNKITGKLFFGMCMVVTLFPWQMASDKTKPTASEIGARFPLGAKEKLVEK